MNGKAPARAVHEQPAPYTLTPSSSSGEPPPNGDKGQGGGEAAPILAHLDLFPAAPEGFKRLRELVLNLAVRGRLTGNPAQFGWRRTSLGTLGNWGSGGTPVKTHPEYYGGDIPWLVIGDLTDGPVFSANTFITGLGLANSAAKLVPQETLLVAMYGSIGKLGITKIECATNQAIAYCIPDKDQALLGFLFLYVMAMRAELTGKGQGLAQQNISQKILKAFPISLPPLAEQSRIVAKVEELMALIDRLEAKAADAAAARGKLLQALLSALADSPDAAATARAWGEFAPHFDWLLQTPADVDRLQQTVLQLAVKGRLVPQDPADEPAAQLLQRIRAEKERLAAAGKLKRDKPLPPIGEEEKPYALPEGWEWVRLGNVISKMDSGWSPACHDESVGEDGWGVLKTTAVQILEYRDFENKRLPANLKPRPDCEVEAGDILITRAGPKNRVGISCLVDRTRPKLMISDKIIRFHMVNEELSGPFVSLCLNAGGSRNYIESAKSGMAESQMNISQTDLKLAPIPVCSLAEQSRIVAQVEALTALCNRLRRRLAARRELAGKLASALAAGAGGPGAAH